MTIQVVSPILRQGAPASAVILEPAETDGNGNSLTLDVKSGADLIGYEMASYTVRAKPSGIGVSVVPLYADRHIGTETERRPEPTTNYFQFSGDASFYRVLYKAELTQFTALVIAARTRTELERRTKLLERGTASCEELKNELCVAIPQHTAINALVPVTVNGSPTLVNWRSTLGSIVRAAGEQTADVTLPRLSVLKPYNGDARIRSMERVRSCTSSSTT